jgi:protease-4
MSFRLNFLTDKTDPLNEFVLEGSDASQKILLLDIDGIISNSPGFNLVGESSSMVEEIMSQINKAEADPAVKAVFLKIDSPGGATTASDLIYHEILSFKERRKVKIFAMMMDVAASGGYMVALSADRIAAQPTTITGSVGVVFIRPKFDGLMNKIGVEMHVSKSGENKDMGSPFRKDSKDEEKLFDEMVKALNEHFYSLVLKHRHISPENLAKIRTARVFLAEEARAVGLIDEIGYPSELIPTFKKDAALSKDAMLVVYRRKNYPNDNIYNRSQVRNSNAISVINLGPLENMPSLKPGFYYLWSSACGF